MNSIKMEDINLDDYDLSYEIQYIQLFIELLKPYIKFEIVKNRSDKLFNIYLINEGKSRQLNQKQFIYFLQLDFPRIIQMRISSQLEEEKEEKRLYNEYCNHVTGTCVRKNLEVLSREEMLRKKEYYVSKPTESFHDAQRNMWQIDPPESEYENKLSEIRVRRGRLEHISRINKKYHGKINDVNNFLKLVETYYL